MVALPAPAADVEHWVHAADDVEGVRATMHRVGYAAVRGIYSSDELDALEAECAALQDRLVRGELAERFGTISLVDDPDGTLTAIRPSYITHVTECSPLVRAAVLRPDVVALAEGWLGECWLLEGDPFGVVYQDARPGRESSYTRIGWHSDWQSGPHLSRWPAVAFTLHLDETSPANGFLRVVPGSHTWATPAPYVNVNGVAVPDGSAAAGGYGSDPPPFPMPLRFEKIPGEAAVYCERGDLLLHDAYLWHSAARATDDDGVRRHIRGSFYTGSPDDGVSEADFVKNAAR